MSSKLKLNGGVALVTGAASGIGKETALAFVEAHAEIVVFSDVDVEGAAVAAAQGRALADRHPRALCHEIRVDVACERGVQGLVNEVLDRCGRIDYFVHCAGIFRAAALGPAAETSVELFDEILAVNLRGAMLCLRAVAKAMQAQEPLGEARGRQGSRRLSRGSIVLLSSMAAHAPSRGMLAYGASKAAIVNMVKTAAGENIAHRIRVNAVCPGPVATPMARAYGVAHPAMTAHVLAGLPEGRMAVAEEVADYCVFLCSASATYVSGSALTIDHALTATTAGLG